MPRMTHEIESKFKVADFSAVRKALHKEGAEYRGTVLQTDRYFDTSDHRLLAGDCGLRIRSVRYLSSTAHHKDLRPLLTYKGPAVNNSQTKIRREIQTRLDDFDAMAEILSICGMEIVITVQKKRSSYKLGDCLIELDELPLIGRFVEIEASSEVRIQRTREKLALTNEPISMHYIDLLSAECDRISSKCCNITFDNCSVNCPSRDGNQ